MCKVIFFLFHCLRSVWVDSKSIVFTRWVVKEDSGRYISICGVSTKVLAEIYGLCVCSHYEKNDSKPSAHLQKMAAYCVVDDTLSTSDFGTYSTI